MFIIKSETINNGIRFWHVDFERNRYAHVDITNDERFFTIRDQFDEPIGTITRPRVIGNERHWESHMCNGTACTKTAVGPRMALRSFLMAYFD